MGRLQTSLTIAVILLVGCGEPGPAGDSTDSATDDGVECYVWRGQEELPPGRATRYEDVYELVLHPDHTYRVLLHYGGPPASMDSFDAGRWAAKDGRITFVPEIWTDASLWRRYFWTRYAPGESVEWAVQPQTTEDPPGSGRFPVDESKPPETVVMERVPCGDLPQRTERAAEECWAGYLEIYDNSPFGPEDGGSRPALPPGEYEVDYDATVHAIEEETGPLSESDRTVLSDYVAKFGPCLTIRADGTFAWDNRPDRVDPDRPDGAGTAAPPMRRVGGSGTWQIRNGNELVLNYDEVTLSAAAGTLTPFGPCDVHPIREPFIQWRYGSVCVEFVLLRRR